MLTKNLIKQRRSIRKYTNQPIPDNLVLEALEAASYAPSAHNAQPWRFILVSDKKVKQKLAKEMADAWLIVSTKDYLKTPQKTLDLSINRFSIAPVLIVACLTLEDMQKYYDERQTFERDLAVQSLGAALQNMLLSASGNGLGACWFSAPLFCKNTVQEVLGIPKNVEPVAIILIGYPDEKPITKQRKSISELCFKDIWGNPF
jgi:F420 biosynthesis protein FbiB-like protein